MKASVVRTLWISLLSILLTAHTCVLAICKRFFSTVTRPWVDKRMQLWARRVLALASVKYEIINLHGTQVQPGQTTVIMCNHSSLYDIPLSLAAFPGVSMRMLAKKELSRIPLMAGGMNAAEFPFVDRKNRRQAILDLEAVQALLKSGIVMWIAPEGTRSKDGKVAPLKKGGFITAIQTKAVIIPIGIRGANHILPAKTLHLNLNQRAEVHIGEPIDASAYTLETKDALIEKTYHALKALAEGPVQGKKA